MAPPLSLRGDAIRPASSAVEVSMLGRKLVPGSGQDHVVEGDEYGPLFLALSGRRRPSSTTSPPITSTIYVDLATSKAPSPNSRRTLHDRPSAPTTPAPTDERRRAARSDPVRHHVGRRARRSEDLVLAQPGRLSLSRRCTTKKNSARFAIKIPGRPQNVSTRSPRFVGPALGATDRGRWR